MTEHSTDLAIFLIVVASRFLVPLAIPRFPLPAMLLAMVIDAADQTIFQTWTTLSLDGYQGYDKALDVYYLTIGYLSTMRNWTNIYAFNTSKFLFYYRMVGVLLFEMTHTRAVLLIFPNTFEYFFDFIEGARLRWDPRKMSKKTVLAAAAFIWIFIKLPQEYWLHVAQLDTTDMVKEKIFGADAADSWSDAVSNRPIALVAILAIALALVLAVRWLLQNKVPPATRHASMYIPEPPDVTTVQLVAARREDYRKFFDESLIEKIVMISIVGAIFSKTLPNISASELEIAAGAIIVIAANTLITEWLKRRGTDFSTVMQEFVIMGAVNLALATGAAYLLEGRGGNPQFGIIAFYAALITVLVGMYDWYRPVHVARWGDTGSVVHALD